MMLVYRVVILGEKEAGKTALTIRICLNHFEEAYDPTTENFCRRQIVVDDQPCILEVLDDAGQEEYTAFRDQWIRDGDGFILVYSVKSRGTFERVERFHRQVLRVKDFDTVPLILVGNRQPQSTAREVSVEEGYHMGRRLRCRFIEVDARSGLNVESAFYSVVRLIRARREQAMARYFAENRPSRPLSLPIPSRVRSLLRRPPRQSSEDRQSSASPTPSPVSTFSITSMLRRDSGYFQ